MPAMYRMSDKAKWTAMMHTTDTADSHKQHGWLLPPSLVREVQGGMKGEDDECGQQWYDPPVVQHATHSIAQPLSDWTVQQPAEHDYSDQQHTQHVNTPFLSHDQQLLVYFGRAGW